MGEETYYEEQYEDLSGDETEIPEENVADSEEINQEDIDKRIDEILEQIKNEHPFGSMGDYFVPEVGCYAFPGEDCFYQFISEEERSGWTAASNGCYVPLGSLEAYEAYLSSGSPEENTEGEEEQLPLPISQEDLAGLQETIQAIYEQDADYHTTYVMHMEQTDEDFKGIQSQLTVISVILIVLCVFLAILCGKSFADTFFNRMRAG